MPIRISITDDHPLAIAGLKMMLSMYGHIEVISSFTDRASLMAGLEKEQPDILMLDILLPDASGIEMAGEVHALFPEISIIAITSLDTPSHVKQMMKQGCRGYLLKNTDQETLLEAIETVYRGEVFIEPSIKEKMLQNMLNYKSKELLSAAAKTPRLTRREKDVLQLIIQEYSSHEIAEKLFLSQRTVENHRFNLLQKLQVKNTVGLVKVAIQMGLV